ncbi:hypothetical protein ACS0TY_011292 [Phlomoides rotata]
MTGDDGGSAGEKSFDYTRFVCSFMEEEPKPVARWRRRRRRWREELRLGLQFEVHSPIRRASTAEDDDCSPIKP